MVVDAESADAKHHQIDIIPNTMHALVHIWLADLWELG